ncbi:MAG: wax ester/triacylglycerol synthase family O-acyltransferase [bacterium]|nr:wax ester/triacylglycerol synthase family O-acyltransferase [bacterium]
MARPGRKRARASTHGRAIGRDAAERRTRAMSAVDMAWLRMEHPTNLMMVTALFIFDRPLDPRRLERTIASRLLRYDRFRRRVVERGTLVKKPTWELDRRFELSAHLRRVALPAPGGEEELRELVSALMSSPLDYSKPLWQIHHIENYDRGCAVLVRIHHAIADGIALMGVLRSLTDDRPKRRRLESRPRGARLAESQPGQRPRSAPTGLRRAASLASRVLREEARILADPGRALELARLGIGGTSVLGRLLLRPADPPTALKGPLGVAKLAAWSEPLPLSDVKAVGKVTGSTVNDVLVAAVTGALRSYLAKRGEPVDDLAFHAAVPVNLRSPASRASLGNRFGLVFVELPLTLADPLERLFEVRDRMRELKGSPEAGVALGLLGTLGMTSTEIQKLLVEHIGARTTLVVTNVPGPRRTVYMAGRPLRTLLFWVPQSGRVGLGISFISYAGNVRLGVASDKGLVPDPETIVALFHREFEKLMDLARGAPRRKAS